MLTEEQKELIRKGLERGLADTIIAASIGAKHIEVYKFRHALGITKDAVLEARYDQWIRLLTSGKSLESIGQLYHVKPDTILSTLYRKRDFSYVKVKKKAEQAIAAQFRRAMGITEKETREQRLAAWIQLANNKVDVESIATMYNVAPSTVKKALKGHVVIQADDDQDGKFDW